MLRGKRVQRRRSGLLLQEALMAILIVMAVTSGACQLLHLVATHRRIAEYRAIAELETANVMEDLLSRSWKELVADTPKIEVSRFCRERLPSPQLRINVTSPDENVSSRRVVVEMDWQSSEDHRSKPVRLVAWRYQPQEDRP